MIRIRKSYVAWFVGAALFSLGGGMVLGAESTARIIVGIAIGAVGFLLFVGSMLARGADPNA